MAFWVLVLGAFAGCSSLPEPKFRKYDFPAEQAFVEPPADRPYQVLGKVYSRTDFSAMLQERTEEELCRNYFNKGARDLVRRAEKQFDADAVVNVRSVVFYLNGKSELHKDAQCSEDEGEGQVLMQGEAVRWVKAKPAGSAAITDGARRKILR